MKEAGNEAASACRGGSCTGFHVRERKPNGRCVGQIYKGISAGGQWLWFLNDRAPAPASDRGYAHTRGTAMLLLKQRWIQRGPLKPGERNDQPPWMKNHPDYKA